MNTYLLPHEQFYTAETAIIKKLKSPVLSKVYTYPIDKKIKWYKPFPEFPNADQDKYFFKYEYIKALRIKMENLQQSLAEEQLREAIENEIEFNEIKKEDRQLQALNNYFKAGLFSFVMTDIKEKYLQNQAKELIKNNTTLLNTNNQIADIRRDDLESLSLSSDNVEIEEEIHAIDRVRSNILKRLDDYEDYGEDDLENIKDILNEMESQDYLPKTDTPEQEELSIIDSVQETEIPEMLNKISEATQTDLLEQQTKNIELEKILLERKINAEKLQNELEKLEARKLKIDDYKTKISYQKDINNAYAKTLSKLGNNIKSFENKIGKLEIKATKKDLIDQLNLGHINSYLTKEELDIILNNFPNIKSSTAPERSYIKSNFNNLFKKLITGNKIDINTLMEGIKIKDMAIGLKEQPFTTKYNRQKIEDLKIKIKDYKKIPLTGTGLKTGSEKLVRGENLQKELEEFLDLESLIPGVTEGIFTDQPATTETHTPKGEEEGDYASEGGVD